MNGLDTPIRSSNISRGQMTTPLPPLNKTNSEIEDSLEALANSIESLGNTLKTMEARLDPVLSPPVPQEQEEPLGPKMSKLGNAIFVKASEVVALRRYVEGLRARLTL